MRRFSEVLLLAVGIGLAVAAVAADGWRRHAARRAWRPFMPQAGDTIH